MQIFPVEYSSLSAQALIKLVTEHYHIDMDASITFLKRGFNDTYLIEENTNNMNASADKYILRVYKHNWRSLESIEAELELLDLLKVDKISVSFPIKDKAEKYIQTIHAPEGTRYAVLFSFAEGKQVRKLSAEQAYTLGVNTGKMHSITKNISLRETAQNYDIEKQFALTLKTVEPILADHPEQYAYLLQLKDDFMNVFSSIDKNEMSYGICHGDLQAENFHISSNGTFTFFDFDFFGTGYLAYDIGVFMWYDHKNKPPEIMNAFLKGYQTQRKLTETEIKLIPYFSTLRALFQMTLYCNISDGKQLPLWPAQQVADFIKKVQKWQETSSKFKV